MTSASHLVEPASFRSCCSRRFCLSFVVLLDCASMEDVQHLTALVHQLQQQLASLSATSAQPPPCTVIPRIPKPETFDGSCNVRSWLWSLDQYFATTQVVDELSRTQFAVNLLRLHVRRFPALFRHFRYSSRSTLPYTTPPLNAGHRLPANGTEVYR